MKNIDISVIMSVYNTKEEYLKASIESILAQDFQDYEFIIVLDCPTDNSAEIAEAYAAKDNRIVILHNETNLGLTISLNKGLSIAKGKYIARMDADDIAVPWRLSVQKRYLDENPDVGVVGGHVYTGKKGIRAMTSWLPDNEKTRIHMLFHNAGVPHPTAMFRSVIEETVVRYDETIRKSQDFALWTELVKKTRIVVLEDVLLLYRIHDGQISAAPKGQFFYSSEIVSRQITQLFGIKDKKHLECYTSIYFPANPNVSSKEIKESLNVLVDINKNKSIYDKQKFARVVNEILIEHDYITQMQLGKNAKSILISFVFKYGIRDMVEFFNCYFGIRSKHDRITQEFETKHDDIASLVRKGSKNE